MAKLDALDVMSRRIMRSKLQGERRSRQRGQSVEFADHRPYVSGDDLRFVDWNIYGRLNQLFLKLFMEEQDLTVHIMLDISGSVSLGDPSKELFIKKLTAALGYVSLVNNNRLTISTFADGIVGQLANIRGRNYLGQMADFLLNSQGAGPSNFEKSCKELIAGRIGSGIMIVLSDFLFKEDLYGSSLRQLAGGHYELYLVQVLSPQELEPDITGNLKLVDVEDEDTAEITVSAALMKYYKRNLSAYCNELKEFCARRGANYVLAKSSDPIESLVLNYLRRIRLLK